MSTTTSRNFIPGRCAVVIGAIGWLLGGGAGSLADGPAATTRPSVEAIFTDRTPQLTADASDSAWQIPPTIDGLSPALKGKVSEMLPTQIRILWDKDFLYVRFISTGREAYAPFGTERDAKHYQGDAVELFLDPVGDGKQYFELQLSPANGVLDQNTLITGEPKTDPDGRLAGSVLATDYWPNLGYEMKGLRTASSVTGKGAETVWIADFALPAAEAIKRTGKKNFEPMGLRMNFMRYYWDTPVEAEKRKLTPMNWSPVRFGCPHQSAAAMGTVKLVNKP